MQVSLCYYLIVRATIGAERGRAARGRPAGIVRHPPQS